MRNHVMGRFWYLTRSNKFNWTNESVTGSPVAVQTPELVVDMQQVSEVLTELVLTGYYMKS